jgi:putative sigma-54 modulation protein
MIKCELTARNFEIDPKVKEYAEEKIGNLDKYLPRRVRGSATATVMLENDPSGREDNRYVCEVVMMVSGTKMVSREATINIYAAIDIVEAKLQSQSKKYKAKVTLEPRRIRMISRWLGRKAEPELETTPEGEAAVEQEAEAA